MDQLVIANPDCTEILMLRCLFEAQSGPMDSARANMGRSAFQGMRFLGDCHHLAGLKSSA